MAIHKLTTAWKKVLERQARPVTLLFTFSSGAWGYLYIRLGKGAPGIDDVDIVRPSSIRGEVISIPVPPNTPVYAKISTGTVHISCTIIKEMEEE